MRIRVGFPALLTPFLRRRVLAITLGRTVWIHPLVMETAPDGLKLLLEHELIHVAQYERDGTIPFLLRYLAEYLRGRWMGMTHYQAYRAVSYEREAWERCEGGSGVDPARV
ncbi:MAG: DUF4157 domain-containing protein [Acidobacteria bacterium]|nr:DUF4157 domain-containing protein [Acidobacteriota bacterium]